MNTTILHYIILHLLHFLLSHSDSSSTTWIATDDGIVIAGGSYK